MPSDRPKPATLRARSQPTLANPLERQQMAMGGNKLVQVGAVALGTVLAIASASV